MIRIYDDTDALAHAAADAFVEACRAAIARSGHFAVALAGGQTPRPTYELLATPPWREAVDWSRVHVFWGDERCVPGDDPRHNGRMAREALLDHVPVPAAQVHAIACAADPEAAAATYEGEFLAAFGGPDRARLDLTLLGLGADGHTASLFPGSRALAETQRRVVAIPATEAGDLPRISLTIACLGGARSVVFLVAGQAKADALHAVLRGSGRPGRTPAGLVAAAAEDVLWLVDRAAAGPLAGREPA